MGKKEEQKASNFRPLYHRDKEEKCFIGHTYNASWRAVIVEVCDEVLPTFGLHPWYADAQFDPTTSLREKVVEMIKNTPYGIYDLSYWRANEQGSWQMPRNVLIELGMAIALNRPTLLLRHAENRIAGLALPDCLQSVEPSFCEFMGGKKSLRDALTTYLPHWVKRSPEQEWRNRYCLFGGMVCDYRKAHPLSPHVIQNKINCHIADGQDTDREDFRDSVEEIIERFDNIGYQYLDTCSLAHGYNFSLCSQCQLVRSTPLAIYRLTAHTPPETFITIGMSIALEAQFGYKIPKLLVTENPKHVPSLLRDNEYVVAHNDQELRVRLAQLLPQVIQRVRETTWRPQALPFEVYLPVKDSPIINQEEQMIEETQSTAIAIEKTKPSKREKVFISYSYKDRAHLDRLLVHLDPLIGNEKDLLAIWSDTRISGGEDWHKEIQEAIATTKVAIFLVSADFLASKYIKEQELPPLMEAAMAGEVTLLPVILSPCTLSRSVLNQYPTMNSPSVPLSSMERSTREKVWAEVVRYVKKLLFPFVEFLPQPSEISLPEKEQALFSEDEKNALSNGEKDIKVRSIDRIGRTTSKAINKFDRLYELQMLFSKDPKQRFKTSEIATILGVSENTALHYLNDLGSTGRLPLMKEGRFWLLIEGATFNQSEKRNREKQTTEPREPHSTGSFITPVSDTINKADRLYALQKLFWRDPKQRFKTSEIAIELEVSEDTALRYLKELVNKELLPLVKEGRFWRLEENPRIELLQGTNEEKKNANLSTDNLHKLHSSATKDILEDHNEEEEQRRCENVIEQLRSPQLKVLQAFANGLHPSEVAELLSISSPTVITHTTVLLSLCRDAWSIEPGERLDYRFLQLKFRKYFEEHGQLEDK